MEDLPDLPKHAAIAVTLETGRPSELPGSEPASGDLHQQMVRYAQEATATRSIDVDFQQISQLPPYFGSQQSLIERLAHGFPFYLELLAGDNENLKRFSRTLPGRKRAARPGTEAVVVAAHLFTPEDEAQRGACSQYSTMLIYAAANSVPIDEFAKRMAGVTLKSCRETAHRYRKVLAGTHDGGIQANDSISKIIEINGEECKLFITPAQFRAIKNKKPITARLIPAGEAFLLESSLL
ncbi:hypothetical protein [Mesorhizobium sp. CN2-181]|uniref:hypothetical protein n=1 Tax=Mesorhizobium yinganensis TaxID=3157707 RepID=UPI0032B7CFDC